jgi:hypothetical protein
MKVGAEPSARAWPKCLSLLGEKPLGMRAGPEKGTARKIILELEAPC